MEYLNTLFNLKDKVAIITGGAGVLAGKMAEGLLKSGAKVILLDLDEENLQNKTDDLSNLIWG